MTTPKGEQHEVPFATEGNELVVRWQNTITPGIYQVEGVPEEQLHPYLLIECPRILFPFARRIIADISAEGGFPPLRIDPVDFGALYNSQKQRAAAAAASQEAAPTPPAEPQA